MGMGALMAYRPSFHILARSFGFLSTCRDHPFLLLDVSALFAQKHPACVEDYLSALASCEAREKEVEEGVGIGVEADLGVRGTGGVGLARVGAGKALFVDADAHRLYGAESGVDQEGYSHGIEKRGGFLAPLVVEERESVSDRSSLAKEEGAFDLVHLQLSRVERHDEEGDSGSEEFLGGGDVVEDVPLRLRRRGRPIAEVAVTALDRATHHDDTLEFPEGGGVLVDGGADVHQRTDGDQRDLARVVADLIEDETYGIGVGRLGEVAGFGVAALREGASGRRGNASRYRDFWVAGFGEKAVEEPSASFGVTESSCNAEDLEFGAAKSQGHSESIVDVIADIGVDYDFFGEGGRRSGLR